MPKIAARNHEDSDISGDEEEEEDMPPLVRVLLERTRNCSRTALRAILLRFKRSWRLNTLMMLIMNGDVIERNG